jgi:signal transduction histidine kinase
MRRLERLAVAIGVVLLVVLPTALHGWPTTVRGNLFVVLLVGGGLALTWWRSQPRVASVVALGAFLVAPALGGWFPDTAVALFSLAFAVLALGWSGRAAWLVTACAAAYLVPFYHLADVGSWVAELMFTVPPYAAGTVLRLRQETADELAARAAELEEERELYTAIVLRHERAWIAAELHDIVGHAISVMVIQAAAGQRLVDADPVAAQHAFAAISESARQGTEDLERLVALLDGSQEPDDAADPGPDLSLVDEVVTRAGRSGLHVTCRFEGARERIPHPVAHLAFRVVQESLTNALRYAPGADVAILIRVDETGRGLTVRVENDRATRSDGQPLAGTGRGLVGLRERVQRLGGQLSARTTGGGGWAVEARLPGG